MEYKDMTTNQQKLVAFVTQHCDSWRQHKQSEYTLMWDEYERLYRGIFNESEKTRSSERSKIVTPAVAQAVDTRLAELAEAVLNNDNFFDIDDNAEDQDKTDVEQVKKVISERFKKDKVKKQLNNVLRLGEIYGTGVGELIVSKVKDSVPAEQPLEGLQGVKQVGTLTTERISVKINPVSPKNFLIDPNAMDIEDALGCAVEEFVSTHKVISLMASGEYRPCRLGGASSDDKLEANGIENAYKEHKTKILRYYGLVPKEYLENQNSNVEAESELEKELEKVLGSESSEDYADLVEAIVIIADDGHLLKASKNVYMMQDRPLVVYRPEIVPGRFWGRGTVEKGAQMQKGLDGQIRSHLDSVALTSAPMMGVDVTRMPRGFKFTIKPGMSILTNGRPSEILEPLTFGQPTPVNIETATLFERMLQQATGTVDSSGLPSQVSNQTDSGALSMALSGIIKKNKQALVNFNEDFLIPFIQKAAWRFMQFDPDAFPVKDWTFIPITSMGIMAREYEQQQFIGLLQTLGPDSPIVPLIMTGILENSSLSNKQQLIAAMQQMSQPNPEQEQAQQQVMQLEMQERAAKVQKTEAEAEKARQEAQAVPIEAKAKWVAALSNNLDEDQEGKDFERRARIAELALKEKDLDIKLQDISSNERIASIQSETKNREIDTKAQSEALRALAEAQKQVSTALTSEKEIIRDPKTGKAMGVRRKTKKENE